MTAEARPRTAWEATDLGLAMARHWSGPVYRAWFALALPVFGLLHLVCWGRWWLVPWLLWWLKPLLDRPVLYVLSHALFDELPTRRQFWRALPGLLRRQALASLTWRRLDPARSFRLPVTQLEGLTGPARQRRLRDLSQLEQGAAVWLTLVCVHFEIGMNLALIALVWMLIPDNVDLAWYRLLAWSDAAPWGQLWLNGVALGGMSLIEPFYVAGGFALYLNRRTWLEAWDLELGFRRLAARLRPGAGVAALILTLIAIGGVSSTPVIAAETKAETEIKAETETETAQISRCERQRQRLEELRRADDPVRRALAETLNDPQLQTCKVQQRWRWRERNEARQSQQESAETPFGQWFAATMETLLWVTLGGFGAVALWWLWRHRGLGVASRRRRLQPGGATARSGQEERIAAPAADVGSLAWRLWQAGHRREALRALYRGSLAGLATRHGLPVSASATEEECLRLATARLPEGALLDFFQRITHTWQAAAYAHRPPEDAAAEALCREWPRHFAAIPAAAIAGSGNGASRP